MYIYHIFFIHSSVNGHLDCFHVLAIVNSTAMSRGQGVHIPFRIMVSSSICPGVGLLDHTVVLFLVFLRNLHTDLCSGCINIHSNQQWKGLYTLSSIYHLVDFFDDGHANWYEVIPHHSFDLHFSPKSLRTVTSAMKLLKDACSLEGKL